MIIDTPRAVEIVADPAETIAPDRHFSFDWNGWGIGIEGDPVSVEHQPGERIAAWQAGVRQIVDRH